MKLQDAVDRLDKIGNQADDALAGGGPLADVAREIRAQDDDGRGGRRQRPRSRRQAGRAAGRRRRGAEDRLRDQPGRHQPDHRYAGRRDLRGARRQGQRRRRSSRSPRSRTRRSPPGRPSRSARRATKAGRGARRGGHSPMLPLAKAAGDKGLTLLAAVPLSRGRRRRTSRAAGADRQAVRRQARRRRHRQRSRPAPMSRSSRRSRRPKPSRTRRRPRLADQTRRREQDATSPANSPKRCARRFPVEIKRDGSTGCSDDPSTPHVGTCEDSSANRTPRDLLRCATHSHNSASACSMIGMPISPGEVITDSGWNCTAAIGSDCVLDRHDDASSSVSAATDSSAGNRSRTA